MVIDYKKELHREPFVITVGQTPLQTASAVLDELRSFPCDLALMRRLARTYPDITMISRRSRPKVMPISHCVDQHWAPGFVHYFEPHFVAKISIGSSKSAPFQKLFEFVWNECSSINPRRMQLDWNNLEKGRSGPIHTPGARSILASTTGFASFSHDHARKIHPRLYPGRFLVIWIGGSCGGICKQKDEISCSTSNAFHR